MDFKPELWPATEGDSHSKGFSGNIYILKTLARPHVATFPQFFIILTNGIALSRHN